MQTSFDIERSFGLFYLQFIVFIEKIVKLQTFQFCKDEITYHATVEFTAISIYNELFTKESSVKSCYLIGPCNITYFVLQLMNC